MSDAVDTVVCAPDDGWKYHPKHAEQFPDINKLCNVASCWIYILTKYVPINVKSPNISKWQMGFNSAFKGLNLLLSVTLDNYHYHDYDHAPSFQIHYTAV
jgi:hypothetical protein